MNKYQEALKSPLWNNDNSHETLKELVDRATPMKPAKTNVYDDFIEGWHIINTCTNCGIEVFEDNCCSNNECRQALDWK